MSTPEYTALITSEYSFQPNFTATVALLADGVGSVTTLIDSLPTLFDLDNAINHELDVDGQWIGFSRTVGGILLVQFFGFGDDASALGFGELSNPAVGGRFYELGEDTSSSATLADPEYRLLLRAKILQNDWDGTAVEFQNALYDILGIPAPVNLCTNPTFVNAVGTTNPTGWSAVPNAPVGALTPPGVNNPAPFYGVLSSRDNYNGSFAVVAGQQYALSAFASPDSSTPGVTTVGLIVTGSGQPTLTLAAFSFPAASTGWPFNSGLVTIPVGYTTASIWINIGGLGSPSAVPPWYFTLVACALWNPIIFDPNNLVVTIAPQQALDPVLSQLLLGYDLLPRAAGVRYQFLLPQPPPFSWTVVGNASTGGATQQTVGKVTGVSAWDSSAFIAQPTTRLFMTWTLPDTANYLMGGFSTNPSGSPSYTNLAFAIFTAIGGTLQVYENGNLVATFGTFAAGDTVGLYWDGKSIVYLHNNIIFYSHAPNNPGSLSPMFSLNTVGAQANNITLWTGQ